MISTLKSEKGETYSDAKPGNDFFKQDLLEYLVWLATKQVG